MLVVTGKWDKASQGNDKKLAALPRVVSMAATEICHTAALDYEETLYSYIDGQQGLSMWVPLSEVWFNKKRIRGLDPRILVASGDYKASFKPELAPLRGSVMGLWAIGQLMEYGGQGGDGVRTWTIPARPHRMPSLLLTLPRVQANISPVMTHALSGL